MGRHPQVLTWAVVAILVTWADRLMHAAAVLVAITMASTTAVVLADAPNGGVPDAKARRPTKPNVYFCPTRCS